MAKRLKIILDRAHGSDVAGKGSPDGTHKEWQWSKSICIKLYDKLRFEGYDVRFSAPEDIEPGLQTRLNRMNSISSPALVISMHNNAAGMGDKWMNARGYSLWTTKGVTNSDKFSEIIFDNIRKKLPQIPYRTDLSDGDADLEANFKVLTSKHPSVMIEWMFQDNQEDLKVIKNDLYNKLLVEAIVTSVTSIEELI